MLSRRLAFCWPPVFFLYSQKEEIVMGWTSFAIDQHERVDAAYRKRRVIDAIEWENEKGGCAVKDIAVVGSVVYAVCMAWEKSSDKPAAFFGVVALTSVSRETPDRMRQFAYKLIDESMGPFDHKAPMRLIKTLDLFSPNPTTHAREWRDAVRRYHAARKTPPNLKPGDRVEYNGALYRLDRRAMRAWHVTRSDGLKFKMPLSVARAAVVVA
jgi:hypothetical protein